MDAELEQTAVWRAFAAAAPVAEQAAVQRLVEAAASILDRIVETFPTYTLHTRRHAHNVVRLMGDLLGPDVERLTALEAAMLVLAAHWHDVGMYYSEDDLRSVSEEPQFDGFLGS